MFLAKIKNGNSICQTGCSNTRARARSQSSKRFPTSHMKTLRRVRSRPHTTSRPWWPARGWWAAMAHVPFCFDHTLKMRKSKITCILVQELHACLRCRICMPQQGREENDSLKLFKKYFIYFILLSF